MADQTGARVRVWQQTGSVAGSLNAREVVAALGGYDGERMLVLDRGFGAFEVVPFVDRK